MRYFSLLAFSLSLVFPVAFSQEKSEGEQIIYPRSETTSQDSGSQDNLTGIFGDGETVMGMLLSTLGYLLVLSGFAVAIWFCFKRGLLRKGSKNMGNKLNVLESRMLGNRQFLMVVEYEDNKVLLGVGPGKIDYLTSLSGYRNDFPTLEPQFSNKEPILAEQR